MSFFGIAPAEELTTYGTACPNSLYWIGPNYWPAQSGSAGT